MFGQDFLLLTKSMSQCGALINDVFTQFMKTFFHTKNMFSKARSRCRFCKILSSLGSKVSVYFSAKKKREFNSLSSPWLHLGLLITSHTPLVTNHTPLVTNHQKTQLGWRPHLPTAVERLLCVQGCLKWDELTIQWTKDCITGIGRQENFVQIKCCILYFVFAFS